MKFKQALFVVFLSAASAIGSVAVYNKLITTKVLNVGTAQNGLPANYAGYFDGKTYSPADPIDLTKAAGTAPPAGGDNKKKNTAKQKYRPRKSPTTCRAAAATWMIFLKTFSAAITARTSFQNNELRAAGLSSVKMVTLLPTTTW